MAADSDSLRTEKFLDTARHRLQDGWLAGDGLPVEDLLLDVPPGLVAPLLPELLAMEIRLRRAVGQKPVPEDFRQRFPAAEAQISEAFRIAAQTQSTPVAQPAADVPPGGDVDREPSNSDRAAGASSRMVLGRFELIVQVGSGGFGTVWRAHDTVLKRTVALKIPRRQSLGADHIADFLREARAAAQIRHRGVVQVYDAGQVSGTAFIASEFIDGRSLLEALAENPFSPEDAARVCRCIAEALHQAHELAIVHLDLKPSNVLLDASGNPHVADFGLARIETEKPVDEAGWVAGTLPYMAPEQIQGPSAQPGPAADIYALGVLLFEMLTGQRPFSGARSEILKRIQHAHPPNLRELDRRIPRDLEAICLKCLAKEPAQRYASAADLAEDLRRYLDSEPVTARPRTVLGRTWRWCQRKPATAILSGVLALVLATAVTGLLIAYWQSQASLETAETHLYFHHISAAHQKWLINDPRAARHLLDACPPRRRGIEWSLLDQLFHTPASQFRGAGRDFDFCREGTELIASGGAQPLVRRWAVPSGDVTDLTQSPGGQQDWVSWIEVAGHGQTFITADARDSAVRLRAVDTGEIIRVVGNQTRDVLQAHFVDQDTRVVSAVRDNTVRVCDVQTGEELRCLSFRPRRLRAIAVTSHGSRVAVSTGYAGDCTVSIWSYETGQQLADIPTNCEQVTGLAFSPDGRLLALAETRGVLQIWQTSPVQLVLTITGPLASYACPKFHPDGQSIAAESWGGAIRIWSTTTGRQLRVLRGHLPPTGVLRFTPDGNSLAAGSDNDILRIWDLRAEQGAIALGNCGLVTDVALCPQGNALAVACGNGSVSMWDTATRTCRWTATVSDERVFSVTFSPDARRLVCACEDSSVQVLDAGTGRRQVLFERHEHPMRAAVFSPDGSLVASAGIGDTVLLWDAWTGEVVQSLSLSTIGIRTLAFDPNGTKIAVGTRDAVVMVWDVQSGQRLWFHNIPFVRVWSLAWSSDGQSLAAARGDGLVRLHAAADGQVLRTFGNPSKDTEVELAFSSDGRRLVTGTAHNLVALWELPTGREVLRLTQTTATAAPVAIDPQNRFVITSQLDGTVLLWPARQDEDKTAR
jgi:WD40 repeat protein